MPPQLEGRAFSRLQQYNALSSDLQTQVEALETHIVAKQTDIFGPHHANLITRVRSVRAKPLLEHIVAYLKAQDTPEPAPVEAPPAPTEATPAPTEEASAPAPEVTAPAEEAPAPGATDATPAPAPVEATTDTTPPPAPAQPVDKYLPQAKTLLEALVLHGFITPNKEQEKLPSATNTPGSLVFKDSELFVPLAASLVPDLPPLSTVWQLVEGAVFAGFAKRKAGFLAPLTQGKDTYIVANETHKSLTLFDTDVGRVPVAHFEAAGTHVAFDKSHFVHGIKVWNENTTELLNAANKLEREALVHTLVSKLGFTYKEEVTLDLAKITSIYDLKDVDIDGNEVAFDTYKGKVLLIVNVSSQCGLTPTNYPELAQLHAKYRDQGLEILAFPSNQFGGQEPGTHEEIKAFVAQYNAEFPFFSKGDVNGPDTRAVFAYLKTKLGLEEHAYVKWNFTKFLVDRNGRPVKRFSPMELPLSFESEIVTLLFTEPEVETKAEVVETTETTTTTETTAPTETVETKTETVVTTTETPATTTTTETVVTTTETPVATTNTTETKTIETVVNKVTTLSVEEHPVQEAAAPAAGEQPQTKVEHLQAEHVQGFTPGNAP